MVVAGVPPDPVRETVTVMPRLVPAAGNLSKYMFRV